MCVVECGRVGLCVGLCLLNSIVRQQRMGEGSANLMLGDFNSWWDTANTEWGSTGAGLVGG